jgi:hypothetical protein
MSNDFEKFALKVPLSLQCSQCAAPETIRIHLDKYSFEWTCPKCGLEHPSFLAYELTIGWRLLLRSGYEISPEKDFAMGIVMAAMAFETELSRLFGKWKMIDQEKHGGKFDLDACEEELRNKYRTIVEKIKGVSRLLVGKGIDEFVSTHSELTGQIRDGFPNLLRIGFLVEGFKKNLFEKRNKILHWGDVKHSNEEALQCYNLAQMGLLILRAMDLERREALERSYKS